MLEENKKLIDKSRVFSGLRVHSSIYNIVKENFTPVFHLTLLPDSKLLQIDHDKIIVTPYFIELWLNFQQPKTLGLCLSTNCVRWFEQIFGSL